MEQIITAKHNPTGQEHQFTFKAWIVQKEKLDEDGNPLYKFISVNKQVSTTKGTNPTPPPTTKKSGCGCGG